MKCSNCPQFTSKDTDTEPEGELEVDAHGMVTGDVRIVNCCSECGNELEETTFTVEIDLTDSVRQHAEAKHKAWLDEAKKQKPKKSKKLPPMHITDWAAKCRNCKLLYHTHIDPATKKRVASLERPANGKWPKDARKCWCCERGRYDNTRSSQRTTFEPKAKTDRAGDDEPSLSVDADFNRTDEVVTKDRKGRPIKRSRYMKRLYGIDVSATVSCDDCKEEIASGTFSDSVQASGMDWID